MGEISGEVHEGHDELLYFVTGAGGSFDADALLAAIGRRPNVDELGLGTMGIPARTKLYVVSRSS